MALAFQSFPGCAQGLAGDSRTRGAGGLLRAHLATLPTSSRFPGSGGGRLGDERLTDWGAGLADVAHAPEAAEPVRK